MPTDKRARQRAARLQKKAAQARRVKRRKLLRNSAVVVVLAGVVLAVVLLTTSHGGAPSSAATSMSAAGKSSTSTTFVAADATKDQAAADKVATAAGCPAKTSTRVNTLTWSAPPAMAIDTSKTYAATVKTTAGTFVIGLDAKNAPTTVNSFVFLAHQNYFHCVVFHRVIPGFMDQTGDPTGTGRGGPGYQFANENLPPSYATGDVAMANSGPDTNGSQFFIVVPGGGQKLQPTYSLFGKVTSGMKVVEQINAEGNATTSANGMPPAVVQRILSVTIGES